MKRRCLDCLAYDPFDDRTGRNFDGICRLNPPQYAGDDANGEAWFYFSEVDHDDWCLQFVLKEEE